MELLEGEVIVSRARSPSGQSGTRLRTQVQRLPLVIAPFVLLIVTFWPVGPVLPLPGRRWKWVGLCFGIKRASGHVRDSRGVHDEPERFWAQLGFSFSRLGQCFLFSHKNTLRALVPGTVPGPEALDSPFLPDPGTEAHLSLNQGHWPRSPKPQRVMNEYR